MLRDPGITSSLTTTSVKFQIPMVNCKFGLRF